MTYTALSLSKEFRMMSPPEVVLLQDCAMQLPSAPVVVNIGAGPGTSAVAVLEVRKDAFIFSVDHKLEPRERTALDKTGLSKEHRVWRVLGDSSKVGLFWPYPIDLCFVDGAHHDSAVIADIEAWKPKVKPGGFMLFHDYKNVNVISLVAIIDDMMAGWERIGEANHLVAFKNE